MDGLKIIEAPIHRKTDRLIIDIRIKCAYRKKKSKVSNVYKDDNYI